MQAFQQKVLNFCRCLLILLLLSMFLLLPVNSASGTSTELLQLQGPRNTSVERGATATLRCRLLIAMTPTTKSPTSKHSRANLRFVPWRASANQRVSVQWNIDGFGFTNDSLMESHAGRYFMPGQITEGECIPNSLCNTLFNCAHRVNDSHCVCLRRH